MFNYVPIKRKQMSFVSNGGKFKLYPVLNGLFFSTPIQLNLKILSCFATNLTPVCEGCVFTYSSFFIWSGNHKFYIQFLRQVFSTSSTYFFWLILNCFIEKNYFNKSSIKSKFETLNRKCSFIFLKHSK
jgi:hypothetical protein